jgi:hypothetical protein
VAETDSAANQFGAPESVEDPRGTFPLFVAPGSAPRIFSGSLDRRVIMSTFDTLPGE